jgi:hypothetical protein
MTYEIVIAGRESVCDEVVPIVSFSRVKRWYGLAGSGKIRRSLQQRPS